MRKEIKIAATLKKLKAKKKCLLKFLMRVRCTVIYKTNLKKKNNVVNAKNATQNTTTTKGQCARS